MNYFIFFPFKYTRIFEENCHLSPSKNTNGCRIKTALFYTEPIQKLSNILF